MVAVAIPTYLSAEDALLVLVICSVAIQAEETLQVRVAHLRTRKPKRPIALCRFCVRDDLLGNA